MVGGGWGEGGILGRGRLYVQVQSYEIVWWLGQGISENDVSDQGLVRRGGQRFISRRRNLVMGNFRCQGYGQDGLRVTVTGIWV